MTRIIGMVLFVCLAMLTSQPAHAESNVLFIFDSSGSMKKQVAGGESRSATAKKAMVEALTEIPADTRLGLMMYGHRRSKDCSDIELVSPIGADDAGTIAGIIEAAEPKGETPIADTLQKAARSFAALKGQTNNIVLVTDGIEECGGDPCAAARAVREAGFDLKVHVVGFTLNDEQRQTIQCIVDETGGTYFEAQDAGGLRTALREVQQQVAETPPPPPPPPPAPPTPPSNDLLHESNGGHLIAAPFVEWEGVIKQAEDYTDTKEVVYTNQLPSEAIFAFKDERPATFDKFAMLVPSTSTGHVKTFEILAGDSPGGEFRSLGQFTTQNIRLAKTPYQEFALPETTAKYLKVKVIDTHGDAYAYLYPMKLFGKLGEATAATTEAPAAAPASEQVNLLSAANGGSLIAAPFVEWEGVIKQAEDYTGTKEVFYTNQLPTEAIFAFKDERPATFDKFAMLVPHTSTGHVKTFEILAGDSPGGEFRSLGQFTTQNIRLAKTPYQEFALPETTAKYLKVRVIDTHGDAYAYLYPMKLFGKLGEATAATTEAPAAAPASAQVNLLSAANGGSLIAAPFVEWEGVIKQAEDYTDTKEVVYTNQLPSEAIFAFKDERPATFDKFAMLVPSTSTGHVKTFEILAGDSPGGEFRSLGQFTTQNIRLAKTPYQEFALPETTAKYLKVKVIDTHGDAYAYLYPMKLFGKLGEATAATTEAPAAAPASEQVNLLSAANGGSLIAAPFVEWEGVIKQAEDYTGTKEVFYTNQLPTEAIFAFKDERPATFDKFAMLVPHTSTGHVKTFEILAGDSPGGEFRSLGQFTTQNIRLAKTPYQEFALPETTAKYLKVRVIDTHGDAYAYLYPMKLFGKLAE